MKITQFVEHPICNIPEIKTNPLRREKIISYLEKLVYFVENKWGEANNEKKKKKSVDNILSIISIFVSDRFVINLKKSSETQFSPS